MFMAHRKYRPSSACSKQKFDYMNKIYKHVQIGKSHQLNIKCGSLNMKNSSHGIPAFRYLFSCHQKSQR